MQPNGWPLAPRDSIRSELLAALGPRSRRSQLLRGPSGVGKTTIAAEVASALTAAGRTVVPVVALAELSGIPLGALAPLLATSQFSELTDASERLGAFVALIGAHASDYVLVVDDAPLLDQQSAAAVYQLVRVFGVPALLTARDLHPLDGAIAKLIQEGLVTVTEVTGLSADEVRGVLVRRLGAEVNSNTALSVHSRTKGNPLFLRELVFAAERAGGVRHGSAGIELDLAALPAHILASVAGHLDALSAEALDLLRLMALSQPWPREAVLVAEESALAELLRSATVVEVARAGREFVELAHPLFAEAVGMSASATPREVRSTAATRLLDLDRGQYHFTAICLAVEADDTVDPGELVWAAGYAHSLGDHGTALRLAAAAEVTGERFGAALVSAGAHSALGDLETAAAEFERARVLAAESTDRALLAVRYGQHLAYRLGDPAAAITAATAAMENLDTAGRAMLEPDIAKWRLMVGDASGLVAATSTPEDALGALNSAIGQAMFATMSGRADEARAALAAGRPLAAAASALMPVAPSLLDLSEFLLLIADGRAAEARDFAEACRARPPADAAGQWSYALAIVRGQAGDIDAAAELATIATQQLRWRDFTGLLGPATALEASLRAQLGEVDEARELVGSLTPVQRSDVKVALLASETEFWLAFHAGTGQDAAAEALVAAVTTALELRHELLAAMSLSLLTRAGRADRVSPSLTAAADASGCTFVSALARQADLLRDGDVVGLIELTDRLVACGMRTTAIDGLHLAERRARDDRKPALAVAAAAAREVIDLGVGSRLQAPRGRADGLTDRELAVALAASQRHRNREIAEQLALSVRTVENHLANVYRKLGIAGRDELAAWAQSDRA